MNIYDFSYSSIHEQSVSRKAARPNGLWPALLRCSFAKAQAGKGRKEKEQDIYADIKLRQYRV